MKVYTCVVQLLVQISCICITQSEQSKGFSTILFIYLFFFFFFFLNISINFTWKIKKLQYFPKIIQVISSWAEPMLFTHLNVFIWWIIGGWEVFSTKDLLNGDGPQTQQNKTQDWYINDPNFSAKFGTGKWMGGFLKISPNWAKIGLKNLEGGGIKEKKC